MIATGLHELQERFVGYLVRVEPVRSKLDRLETGKPIAPVGDPDHAWGATAGRLQGEAERVGNPWAEGSPRRVEPWFVHAPAQVTVRRRHQGAIDRGPAEVLPLGVVNVQVVRVVHVGAIGRGPQRDGQGATELQLLQLRIVGEMPFRFEGQMKGVVPVVFVPQAQDLRDRHVAGPSYVGAAVVEPSGHDGQYQHDHSRSCNARAPDDAGPHRGSCGNAGLGGPGSRYFLRRGRGGEGGRELGRALEPVGRHLGQRFLQSRFHVRGHGVPDDSDPGRLLPDDLGDDRLHVRPGERRVPG